jgi:hypothetical protein
MVTTSWQKSKKWKNRPKEPQNRSLALRSSSKLLQALRGAQKAAQAFPAAPPLPGVRMLDAKGGDVTRQLDIRVTPSDGARVHA